MSLYGTKINTSSVINLIMSTKLNWCAEYIYSNLQFDVTSSIVLKLQSVHKVVYKGPALYVSNLVTS